MSQFQLSLDKSSLEMEISVSPDEEIVRLLKTLNTAQGILIDEIEKRFNQGDEKVIGNSNYENTSNANIVGKRIFTVKQLAEAYPIKSISGWRHTLFYRESNGFNSCIRKMGRQLIIIEENFLKWIEQQ